MSWLLGDQFSRSPIPNKLRNPRKQPNHNFGAATEQFKQMTAGAAAGANDDKEKPELI
jgi:hypothetical protein